MIQVFIDGKAGTTGLRIYERLKKRDDIKIVSLSDEERKQTSARKRAVNDSDVTFLCLPDDAAREAVQLCDNPDTVIIDASTAHRTAEGWAYGFPELSAEHRKRIAASKRIANPGCYASGFIALVYPLIRAKITANDYPFVCHAVSGYSGGGKSAIAQYTATLRERELDSPRLYGLTLSHKHIPEMMKECSLTLKPIFNPYICNFECGMTVNVPIFLSRLNQKVTVDSLLELYRSHYENSRFISVKQMSDGMIAANTLCGTNQMELFVHGNEEQAILSARFDNLGKGASGAAIQNMNLALGLDETIGL
jgi:N-acetyl-gamma-glutamyl-phosphate reductase